MLSEDIMAVREICSTSEIESELNSYNIISSVYYEIKDTINSLGISYGEYGVLCYHSKTQHNIQT